MYMIKILEKRIEFCVYDYPYDNKNLKKYHVGDIEISHSTTNIEISFKKKDLIAAVGTLMRKIENINFAETENIKIYIKTLDNKNGFEYKNMDNIFYETAILTCEDIGFIIKSDNYDLEKEMGIICYYDLDDLYEDEILWEILKEINDVYKI